MLPSHPTFRSPYLWGLLCLLLSGACGEDEIPAERLDRFGRDLVSLVQSEEFDEIDPRGNYRIFTGRILRDYPTTRSQLQQLGEYLAAQKLFSQILANQAAYYGSFEFLRSYQKQWRRFTLFRWSEQDQFDYLILELRSEGEQLKIVDGQFLSRGMSLVEATRAGEVTRIAQNESESLLMLEATQDISTLLSEGDYLAAAQRFSGLPEALQQRKIFRYFELLISLYTGDGQYESKVSKFSKQFPELRSSVLYQALLWHYQQVQCERLRATVTDFYQTVGADPWLQTLVERCRGKEFNI